MGEAKRRGSLEARTQDEFARLRAALPDSVTCNNCGAELREIRPIDGRAGDGRHASGWCCSLHVVLARHLGC